MEVVVNSPDIPDKVVGIIVLIILFAIPFIMGFFLGRKREFDIWAKSLNEYFDEYFDEYKKLIESEGDRECMRSWCSVVCL